MEYVKVESSQIAEVGFGEGHYGPDTLGLKFPPNRKQQAAGEPGSIYHYQNVSSRTHQALMAAPSIGIYFGQNIKNNPAYPYVKVEPENPPQPPPSANGGGATTSTTNTVHSTPTTDAPAPGTALALIDTMADDLLFTPGAITDAQLAAGRDWYLTEAKKYDISTDKARTELKRFARPLQKLRTGIEARAKELTGATKRKIAAIDAEKRRLVQIVGGIEDEVLAPLTAWEQEDESRKIHLSAKVNELTAYGQFVGSMDVPQIEAAIKTLEVFDLSTMQEYKVGAESAMAASLRVLKPELERRKLSEANEAELAKLRADAAARADADRLAIVAKEARDQAERAGDAERERLQREKLAAEQRAVEAEARAKRDQEQAVENERMRVAVEAKRKREEDEARAADDDHRCKVNKEAIDAMAKHLPETWGMAPEARWNAANAIVSAIAANLIPHVTIEY